MDNLPTNHSTGVEFFRFKDLQPLNADGYFECLNLIRSLFKDPDFCTSTPGFYFNRITNKNDDNGNSLRLTYYTIDPIKTSESIKDFINQNNKIAIFNSSDLSRPSPDSLKEHDPEELRFRNFLNRNTKICLEILENYGEHSFREIVTWYRYIGLPQKIHPKSVFGPVFEKHSNYFNELRKNSFDNQYWEDLVFVHKGKNFGFHFMVNMIAVPESEYNF
jgi:hypothetical protein